ncbi:aminoglycoside phosphotransferase family protein [Actinomycetospora sp. C-140]
MTRPSPATVRRLVAEQFPGWAGLAVDPDPIDAGSDHVVYQLGDDLVARFPVRASAAAQVAVEQRWLPVLAPAVPVPIPAPVGHGRPGHGYPWPWSVLRWLPGEDATRAPVADPHALARDLAAVACGLRGVDAAGGPDPAASGRGVPLADRDGEVRAALDALRAAPEPGIDLAAAARVWDAARDAPVHHGPPSWLHGDLLPGNLLIREGRLSAVIDFGCAGVGDPAVDLLPAWAVLPPEARATFRDAVGVDQASWRRGRGWAVAFGLVALPYHRTRTPALARVARRAVIAAIAEA